MADEPDYINGEPPPVPNGGPSMHDLVCIDINARVKMRHMSRRAGDTLIELMADRRQYGLQKYGTLLQANNGRNPLVDAKEEALDLLVYARQAVAENPDNPLMKVAYYKALETAHVLLQAIEGH